jgi:hypothetical protein
MKTREGHARVRRLAPAFDVRLDGLRFHERVIVGMALRGIAMYDEVYRAADRYPMAASAQLRSLVDLTILLRWIEGSPKLRVAMWHASDDLDRLETDEVWQRVRAGRGHPTVAGFSPAERRRIERRAERIRRIALAAGERIDKRLGRPLLPNTRQRVESTPDSVEVYAIFSVLSKTLHVGARAFAKDEVVKRPDGWHLRLRPTLSSEALRGLAVPTLCMLLAAASRVLKIGAEGDLDATRTALAGWAPPVAGS